MSKPLLNLNATKLNELRPNPKNPRRHSPKQITQIANSIRRFGFVVPVLTDGDHTIIAGHGRWLAAKQLGLTEVPTLRVAHLSPAEITALMIADNKLTENAAWDRDLLKAHFLDLSGLSLDFDLGLTGFETAEIDLLLQDPHESQEPALPALAPVAISRPGDLWQLGQHRLLCGNSLHAGDYERVMAGRRAAMIFTDPPYNVPIQGHVSSQARHREFAFAAGEMSRADFTTFLKTSASLMARHSRAGSLHYICMDWRHMGELVAAGEAVYAKLQNLCVWVKSNGGMGSLYRSRHELVFVFKHGSAAHHNNVALGAHGRSRTNVWEYAGANGFVRKGDEAEVRPDHPTPKPVALIADAILDCTRRGDIVLDPFLGSGSTVMAAERVGRCCYGIEIDPLYVDLILRRFQAWTGQEPVHVETGLTFAEYTQAQSLEPTAKGGSHGRL